MTLKLHLPGRLFLWMAALLPSLTPAVAQPSATGKTTDKSVASPSVNKAAVASFKLPATNLELSTFNVQPKYELRAAWIATVANIDWPSKKGLSPDVQKEEYIRLLDSLQQLGMNAVIVQVRPAADAFYPSPYEPWSEWLSGKQGVAPYPYYDPLKFMIAEAHKRNMEFHAWLNPYRAVFDTRTSSVSPNHITRVHKDWFLTYGGKKYFNPGLPDVMQYVTNVVKDIITRYDVDAIHMDDYFYPYRIAGKEFPDQSTYLRYKRGLDKDDWRRSNCDSIIKMIHNVILTEKPMVKFGISPFGVWRNKSDDDNGSDTRAGQTNYDDLYADILLWLKQGWIDYVAPQLYWEIGNQYCDYETLLDWWSRHSYGKDVYVGHALYRTIEHPSAAWRNPEELPDEIRMLRENKNIEGSIYFSASNFYLNPNGWSDTLKNDYYSTPALVPPMPWIDTVAPKAPAIYNLSADNGNSGKSFSIYARKSTINETESVKSYVVYISPSYAYLGALPTYVIPANGVTDFNVSFVASQIPADWNGCYIAVSSVDKENNESELSNVVQLIKTTGGWALPKEMAMTP